jgi:RNA polymerase sigma factor (sigma-70 family)
MSEPKDAELLRRYADEKSEAAFGELVRRQVNLVYSIALRQCGGDAHLAEDVAQRVFTDLARKARQLSGYAVLGGWLYRSAQFAASDVVRAERRRRAREQEAQAMQQVSDPAAGDADWQKLAPVLDQAIGELAARDRDAVVLRFFEGRPFAEIGATLRLTEDAARMRVERALDKLRAALVRRGVTSTTAALAVVLANQTSVAAPAGLAATVSGMALAGAATGGLWTFMITSKLTLGIVSAVAALAAGTAVYQTAELHRRDAALAAANASQEALSAKLRELEGRIAAEAKRVQVVDDDNAKLLKVIDGLKASHAAQAAETNAPITHDMVDARYKHAQQLARNGDTAGALAEFLWCFDVGMVRVSSYAGVRVSFLLSEIAQLGEQDSAALDALRERRDQAKQRVLASINDNEAAMNFSAINRTLKDDQATLAVLDQLPADDGRRRPLASAAYEQLVVAQRYADAALGRSSSSMNAQFEFELNQQERPLPANMPDPERVRKMQREHVVTTTAESVEVLAGAGDLAHARTLSGKLLAYDGSEETKATLQQHLARAGHPELLANPPKP